LDRIPLVRARIWFCIGCLPSSHAVLIGRTLSLIFVSLLLLEEVLLLLIDELSVLLTEEAEEAEETEEAPGTLN